MKLIHSPASPFARKARILLHELDLMDTVELVEPGTVTPVSNNAELNSLNPLGMIPTLLLDSGETLYDSPVICEYLNYMKKGAFFPHEPVARFKALKLQALGDGIMDLSVALRYETALRPPELQWSAWIEHQNEKVERALSTLNLQCDQFNDDPTIGEVTVACALGYRDFRFSDSDWRVGNPALCGWYANIIQRPSLSSTIPG